MTMKLEEIEIEKIRANDRNIRVTADDETIDALAAEIQSMGLQSPLRVYPHPTLEGDYLVQDGHRRRLAAIKAGLSKVPCMVVATPKDAADDYYVMYTTGRNHKSTTALEQARAVQGMLEVRDVTTVAKRLKKSRKEVQAQARILTGPETVQTMYGKGSLDLLQVQRLQELEDAGQTDVVQHVLDQLDPTGNYRPDIERMIATAEAAAEADRTAERLAEAGATVERGMDAYYKPGMEWVREELDEAEHIAAGHTAIIPGGYMGDEVRWIRERPATAPAAAELTEEEKARQKKIDHLNGALAISKRVRLQVVEDQIRSKDGAGEDADKKMLVDIVRREASDALLESVTGISQPKRTEPVADDEAAADLAYEKAFDEWDQKVDGRLEKMSFRQLTRLLAAAAGSTVEMNFLSNGLSDFDPRSWYWRDRVQPWLMRLQDGFGYRFDEIEKEALAFHAEHLDEGTPRVEIRDADQ